MFKCVPYRKAKIYKVLECYNANNSYNAIFLLFELIFEYF